MINARESRELSSFKYNAKNYLAAELEKIENTIRIYINRGETKFFYILTEKPKSVLIPLSELICDELKSLGYKTSFEISNEINFFKKYSRINIDWSE